MPRLSRGSTKYEERWVGTDGTSVYPSASVTINPSVIAKPTVISPPDGAGQGGDVSYFPETSEATSATNAGGTSSDLANLVSYHNGWQIGSPMYLFDGNDNTEFGMDGSVAGAGANFQVLFGQDKRFVDGTFFGRSFAVKWGPKSVTNGNRFYVDYTDGSSTMSGNGSPGGTTSVVLESKPVERVRIHNNGAYNYYITVTSFNVNGTVLWVSTLRRKLQS